MIKRTNGREPNQPFELPSTMVKFTHSFYKKDEQQLCTYVEYDPFANPRSCYIVDTSYISTHTKVFPPLCFLTETFQVTTQYQGLTIVLLDYNNCTI